MFAPTGELVQVHMANKIFPTFLNVGIWLFLLLNLRFVTFYEVKRIRKKMDSAWKNFKKYFF
jgi:hypothetical protein